MIIGLCPQTVYAENETGQAENSQQTAEQGEGYHFVDLELPKTAGTQSKAGVRAYGAGIPEKYDARSLIGTVRKQGGYQTCWSFAALASAEASSLRASVFRDIHHFKSCLIPSIPPNAVIKITQSFTFIAADKKR